MNNWISVKDKLPKVLKKVLVYVVNNHNDTEYCSIGYMENNMSWYNDKQEGYSYNVTHWQPLPPKPKEGN